MSVVVCTNLSGKGPHSYIGMDMLIASGRLGGVIGKHASPGIAGSVGSNLGPCLIVSIFITSRRYYFSVEALVFMTYAM